jgi:hypothetical protein
MYYGVFYAALALLAMHGAWIDFGYTKAIVYVNNGYLGSQEIVLRKDLRFINALSSLGGPHRKFWDLFYATVATLIPSLPVGRSWSLAITPVLGNRTWLIDKRNEINYDSSKSVDLIVDFQQNFKARNFRRYLPGDIKLQYEIMINIVELVFHFAKLLNVNSDALRQISPRGTRKQKILTKVFNPRMPRLLNQIRTSRIF